MRLASDSVAVTIHMFAIAGIATIQRGLASVADFVAAVIIDGLLHSIARGDFFFRDGR